MPDYTLPSITVLLTGYNEEHCIADAIQSIFNQDYDGPVEIIMSDDGSTDRTFQIMKQMAAEYTGPFSIVLNRNEKSLRLGYHLLQLVQMAKYDWIIRQDGDDYSFPWKCKRFAEAVLQNPDTSAVCGQFIPVFEEAGKVFQFPPLPAVPTAPLVTEVLDGAFSSHSYYTGAVMMKREAYLLMTKERMTAYFEDELFALGAWLMGDIYEMKDSPLYFYRFGEKNICAFSSMQRFKDMQTALNFEDKEITAAFRRQDSKLAGLHWCQEEFKRQEIGFRKKEELIIEIEARHKALALIKNEINWWSYPFRKRLKLRSRSWFGIIKCLPKRLYCLLMVLFFKLRKIKRKIG